MINKALNIISSDDFMMLISNGVSESKTIEYKSDLPNDTSDSKKEFLADVSSFANAEGGDLILGIKADKGIPIEICGINVTDNDKIILQYENIIRDGISPRIKTEIKIYLVIEKRIMLIRIYKSWNKPHRIEYKDYHRFYARNSAGKYLLDIDELRTLFLSGEEINDKISSFIKSRNNAILNNEAMMPLTGKGKIAFYLIPIDSLSSKRRLDVINLKGNLRPPFCHGWNSRINLEGYMNYSPSQTGETNSYAQIYRNGIIEVVNSSLLTGFREEDRFIPSVAYESEIIVSVKSYLEILKNYDIYPPFVFGLSFINIRNYHLSNDRQFGGFGANIIYNKDILQLPEILITEFTEKVEELLHDTFDAVWNTFGFEKSHNYDKNGKWIGK